LSAEVDSASKLSKWKSVSKIPRFPFRSFAELQRAASERKATIGVDPLAAAEWANVSMTGVKRATVTMLSLLLVAAAVAAIVTAVWTNNYWLALALPVQAAMFYFSQPGSPVSQWVTLGGIALVIVFLEFLLKNSPTSATVAAYAVLTFAAVRASGFITNSAFRKALLADESLFLEAYQSHACTVRDNDTKEIYEYNSSSK
jgi:hypothetical protein